MPGATPPVRPAGDGDIDEVVRLAELMYRALGMTHPDAVWARWRRSAATAVATRLGADLTVVVAEDPGLSENPGAAGHLVACGAATISTRLPNPAHGDARLGYIQWMSTEPSFRRRGLGRAVLGGLLSWLAAQGVDNVELHASPDGAGLYRLEGFWEGSTGLAMRRRSWDPPRAP